MSRDLVHAGADLDRARHERALKGVARALLKLAQRARPLPASMARPQLRMAIGATQMTLRAVAAETGMTASQISRIQTGTTGASTDTMRRLELYFTGRGLRFSQANGDVTVTCPDPLPEAQSHEAKP